MADETAHYLFTGSITTAEPLAYSPPDHRGADKVSRLPRMPVPSAAGPMDTVYLSGGTIRGTYRHACADVWLARERTVTVRRFLEVKVGGVKGSAEEPRVGLTERAAYLEGDPFLALFGAGSSPVGWIHSRVDVGAALPGEPVQPIRIHGARGDATTDPILLGVLDEAGHAAVLDGLAANRRRSQAAEEGRGLTQRIRQAKREAQDTAAFEQELETAREAERTAAGVQSERLGSDVSLLLPLPGYEAIPPGTVLGHRMVFRHVTDRQMALFVGGLAHFAEDPRFGGHRAHGCGRVRVDYQIKRLEGTRARSIGAASVDPQRWDADGSSLSLSGAPERWLCEWQAGHA